MDSGTSSAFGDHGIFRHEVTANLRNDTAEVLQRFFREMLRDAMACFPGAPKKGNIRFLQSLEACPGWVDAIYHDVASRAPAGMEDRYHGVLSLHFYETGTMNTHDVNMATAPPLRDFIHEAVTWAASSTALRSGQYFRNHAVATMVHSDALRVGIARCGQRVRLAAKAEPLVRSVVTGVHAPRMSAPEITAPLAATRPSVVVPRLGAGPLPHGERRRASTQIVKPAASGASRMSAAHPPRTTIQGPREGARRPPAIPVPPVRHHKPEEEDDSKDAMPPPALPTRMSVSRMSRTMAPAATTQVQARTVAPAATRHSRRSRTSIAEAPFSFALSNTSRGSAPKASQVVEAAMKAKSRVRRPPLLPDPPARVRPEPVIRPTPPRPGGLAFFSQPDGTVRHPAAVGGAATTLTRAVPVPRGADSATHLLTLEEEAADAAVSSLTAESASQAGTARYMPTALSIALTDTTA